MAAEQSDGSLIIDTELDREGFEKGTDKLLTAVKELVQAVDTLGDNMMRSFGKMTPMLQSVANATASINEKMGAAATQTAEANERVVSTEEKVTGAAQEAANAVNQQATATNTTRTSVSSLEKEINSLSHGLQAVSQSTESGFANGKAVLAFDSKINDLEQRLESARTRLVEFGETQIPTDEYKSITAQIERAEQALFKLYDRRDTLEALGVKENSVQWQRLAIDIKNAETILSQYERGRDNLAANGGAFVSGKETDEFARMQKALDDAGITLERNKSLVDQEALAQARLNVLTAQEAVAAASTTAERTAALQRLQEAQMQLSTLAASMSNNPNMQPPAPDEERISLWHRLGEGVRGVGTFALHTASALARISFTGIKAGVSVVATLGKTAFRGMASAAKLAANGVKNLGNRLKNLITHAKKANLHSNSLVKTLTSMKRLLLTRIKRMFISAIFNSAKESLQTLAKFSDSFNTAMSNIKNSAKQLSANLAVTMGTLIEKIEPYITKFLDTLSQVITYVNYFLAILQGKETMTVAKKQTDSYRDSLEGAAKAAEELKNQVYGFDELNKRNGKDEDEDSEADDGSDLFEEVPIEDVFPEELEDVKEFIDELKDLWEDEDFYGFGEKLADAFNDLLKKLDDWINNVLRPKGVEWAKNIAELLNGLVDGVDWELLGKTVADGINAIFDIINTFLKTFDFEKLGRGIGRAINSLFENIEWDLIGETFANAWNALVDFIFGIVDEVDWALIGDSLAEAIQSFANTIDWQKTAQTIATAVNGIVEALEHLFTGVDWVGIGEDIGQAINTLFRDIDWDAMGEMFADNWNVLIDLIYGCVKEIDWGTIGDSFAEGFEGFINRIKWDEAAETISTGVNGIVEAFNHLFNGVDWENAGEHIGKLLSDSLTGIDWGALFQTVIDGVNSLFELILGTIDAFEWREVAHSLAEGINQIDIVEMLSNAAKIVNDVIVGVLGFVTQFIEDIDWHDLTQKLWDSLVGIVNNIDFAQIVSLAFELLGAAIGAASQIILTLGENIWKALKEAWESVKTYFSDYIDQFGGDIVKGLWEGIKNAFINVGTWIKENIFDPFIEGFKKAFGISSPSTVMVEMGKYIVEGLLQGIKNVWNSITEFFKSSVETIKNTLSTAWETIKQTATQAWENIKTGVTQKFDAVKQSISTTVNNVKSTLSTAWNNIKQTTTQTWESIKTAVKQKFDAVKQDVSTTANNIKSTLSTAWNNIKSTTSTAWDNIKTAVKQKFDTVKQNISTTANNVKSTLSTAWNNIKSTASSAWDGVKTAIKQKFDNVKQNVSTTVNNIKSDLQSRWNDIKSAASTAWEGVKSTVTEKFNNLKSGVTNTANNIKSDLSNAWNNIKSTAQSSWNGLTSTVSSLWNGLKNTLHNTDWSSVGSNLVSGIQRGIQSGWSWLTSTVSSLASSLFNTAKSVLGINSPSTVFAEIGENVDKGLQEGIAKHERTVLSTVSDMAQNVTDQFDAEKATLRIGAEGEGLTDKLSGITAKLSDIANVFREINSVLANMGGLRVPSIAAGTEVPYKTRVSSDTSSSVADMSSRIVDERLADFAFLLRQILDLLERKKLGVDNDELAAAIAFALNGAQRGYGGV